jgi:hypothetical protein
MVTSPKGLGPVKDYAAESQKHIQKTPVFSSERAPHKNKTVTVNEQEISGHEPQMGLDTKTYRLTDLQSRCDFDFTAQMSEVVEW